MLMFYLSMMDSESDRALFEKIYTKYSNDIFRRVYGMLKNQADAEDCAQDTWQKVCEHMDILNGKDEPVVKAYIMSIAKNQALTLLRKRKKDEAVMQDTEYSDIVDESALFDACEKCDEEYILECMKALGPTYCDVLVYYYFHEHTIREIAAITGVNESTVGSRLTRGREKLVKLLERRLANE